MPWFALLITFSFPLFAQPSTPYSSGIQAVENLSSEVVVTSKEGSVLSIKNVKINGQNNQFISELGGIINLSFEYKVHCKHCLPDNNQLLLGLHFQHTAQTCVQLPKRQSRWTSTKVQLFIPYFQGNHYIRARHSAAFNCIDALDWWRLDRPLGPDSQANIGMVQILAPQNLTHTSQRLSLP